MSSTAHYFVTPLPPSSTDSALTPVFAPTSTRQFPLGSDIGGVLSVDLTLSVVTGRTALAQAILRRLSTPLGGLFYAPTYGYALSSLIGSTVPASVVQARVRQQVLLEEEVEDASCQVAYDASVGSMTVDISVIDADGPFDLTLTVDQLTLSALIDGVPFFQQEL